MFEQFFPENTRALTGESAFEVLAKAKALEAKGTKVVHLEIGEPDFPTPPHIVQAGIDALHAGMTKYVQVDGLPVLREAIANSFSAYNNVDVQPDEIIVTPGGKPVMYYTILALTKPGDEVLCPDPGFSIYSSVVRYAGGTPVFYGLREENNFRMDMAEVERLITPRTKLIITNSPNNPTGSILTKQDLEALAKMVTERRIFVMADEIYDRIYYDEKPVSFLTMPGVKDYTIILNGFSKTYSMTGWRMGYMVANKEILDVVRRMMVSSVSCIPPFIQMAGKAALEGSQDCVEEMVAEFRKRRDFIVAGLNSIPGVSCLSPAGAFYVFPNIKETGMSSRECADHLLNNAATAVIAGGTFGDVGEGYIRLSYVNSLEILELAVTRIEQALKNV